MVNVIAPVVLMVVGALVYLGAATRFAELGRLVFLAGALALAWLLAGERVHL